MKARMKVAICMLSAAMAFTGAWPAKAAAQNSAPVSQSNLTNTAEQFFNDRALASLLIQIRIDGKVRFKHQQGMALAGVPVTADAHFRNGAVAIAYMAATLLKMSEQGVVALDEPISKWLPELPDADRVTPRMLANMTAGYPDYVADPGFVEAFYDDPFRNWTNQERISISINSKRLFEPGTNWDYSHSAYVILAQVLQKASGKPLAQLMREHVLAPLKLENTHSVDTPEIPAPVVHGYTAERGVYEDATYWNPSWTLPAGAVQVSTIDDMARSFDTLVGRSGFLPEPLRQQMIAPDLVGFGKPLDGCRACHTLSRRFHYGLGVFMSRDWVFQSPLFGGYASMVATLPEERSPVGQRVTIAVAVTMKEEAFADWTTDLENHADELTRLLAAQLVPGNPMDPLRH